MGVKGLWTLFGPFCDKKSLYEIRGEKVAIDLSGWICDCQNATDQYAQPRLYLRNLFFRTTYLLVENITPIFVLEGKAPLAKQTVMANRNLLQFRTHADSSERKFKKPDRNRKHFAAVLAQCEKLLNCMGLECVQGVGEAEAMCAHLNSKGAVCAVISQDSDCFVYGAVQVYRNFSVSKTGTGSSGSVDVYDIREINKKLNFGRKKMVALALLCGCDYNGNGVDGIGYSNAVNFLQQYSEEDILERLNSWKNDSKKFEDIAKKINDTNLCSGCGHDGNIRSHTRSGCKGCKTYTGCDQSYKEYRQNVRTELNIRNKALQNGSIFPDNDLIDEFLVEKEETPENFRPRWKKPDLIKFIKLMNQYLAWNERYCVEKFLPLITRWQLLYKSKDIKRDNISLLVNDKYDRSWLSPEFIKKKRNPKGIPCFEVVWQDTEGYYDGLIPDDQIEGDDIQSIWTTIERQDLMESAYPDIVEKFLESKKKKPKKPKKNNTPSNIEDLCTSINNMSLSKNLRTKISRKRKNDTSNVSFKTKPRKYKKKQDPKQKKLDSFMKCKKSTANNLDSTDALMKALNADISDDNVSEADLSNIIEDILTRNKDMNIIDYIETHGGSNFLTPIKSYFREKFTEDSENNHCSTPVENKKRRFSYFFNLDEDDDVFERSIDLKNSIKSSNVLHTKEQFETPKKNQRNSSLQYTPLMERIKRLNQIN